MLELPELPPHPLSNRAPEKVPNRQRRSVNLLTRRRVRREIAGKATTASTGRYAGQPGDAGLRPSDVVTVCCVLILRDTGVGLDPTVTLEGVKVHVAYAGRLAQLIVTTPVNVPTVPMLKLKFAGCPPETVAVEAPVAGGKTKSGATTVPAKLTLCDVAPTELTVTIALSSPVLVGLNETVTLHVALTATVGPQAEATVKSVEFCPATVNTKFASAMVPELRSVNVCCAKVPADIFPNERD